MVEKEDERHEEDARHEETVSHTQARDQEIGRGEKLLGETGGPSRRDHRVDLTSLTQSVRGMKANDVKELEELR
jgi:hypothetical protein